MRSVSHDILIIGAGLAGQRAAIEARKQNMDVGIISKEHPVRSASGGITSGINAALGKKDHWKNHARDTVYGGDFLGDQDAIELVCKDAPDRVQELESWGMTFSRTHKGDIAQHQTGGHSSPRTCYAGDQTGNLLLHTLYDQLMKSNSVVYGNHYCLSLLLEENNCKGALVWDIEKGKMILARAGAVILATGGCGSAFATTSNSRNSTGDGLSLAWNAGLSLQDMEMIQFHPTGMHGKGFVVPEAGEGATGRLLNRKKQSFLKKYAPSFGELAPRDIVTRAIATEINQKRGCGTKKDHVFLDMRDLEKEKIMEHLPETQKRVEEQLNIDCVTIPIPVGPTAHYCIGGIPTDLEARVTTDEKGTTVDGLFAAGETACVSMHGANNLGGNSLLETMVFGRIAGISASTHVRAHKKKTPALNDASFFTNPAEKRIDSLLENAHTVKSHLVQKKLQKTMTDYCGVYRNHAGLMNGIRLREKWNDMGKEMGVEEKGLYYNTSLIHALETQNLLSISQAILHSALKRKESRGVHARSDYPRRNDKKWLMHSLAQQGNKGVRLFYKGVVVKQHAPEARHY